MRVETESSFLILFLGDWFMHWSKIEIQLPNSDDFSVALTFLAFVCSLSYRNGFKSGKKI